MPRQATTGMPNNRIPLSSYTLSIAPSPSEPRQSRATFCGRYSFSGVLRLTDPKVPNSPDLL